MCHLMHRLRIFLFRRKIVFRSQDIQVFVFSTSLWFAKICGVTMSISTQDKVHFWICLLNLNSWSYQTWLVDRYKQGQQFSVIFWAIWRTGARFQVLFNLATCPNYSLTKCQDSSASFFFEKVNEEQLKMLYVNH